MSNLSMTETIASHDLIRIRPDGVRQTFTIEFGKPSQGGADVPRELENWYYCPVQIIGYEKEPAIHAFYGRDSMQAIQAAIAGAGAIVRALPFADEFIASGLPNFGFALDPIGVARDGFHLSEKQQATIAVLQGTATPMQQTYIAKLRKSYTKKR